MSLSNCHGVLAAYRRRYLDVRPELPHSIFPTARYKPHTSPPTFLVEHILLGGSNPMRPSPLIFLMSFPYCPFIARHHGSRRCNLYQNFPGLDNHLWFTT